MNNNKKKYLYQKTFLKMIIPRMVILIIPIILQLLTGVGSFVLSRPLGSGTGAACFLLSMERELAGMLIIYPFCILVWISITSTLSPIIIPAL